MAKQAISDNTYSSLPHPGEKDAAKLQLLSSLAARLGLANGAVRNIYIGDRGQNLTISEMLYLRGRDDWVPGDMRPTVNRIQNTINTFTADACRTPASIVIKSTSFNQDGPWVLIKPFTIHPQAEGGQPIPLKLFDPIDDDVVEFVPEHRRYCVNTENAIKWIQISFDAIRDEIEMDQTIRDMIHRKQIDGWVMGLTEWDPVDERPVYKLLPTPQWYPDPLKSDVKDMNNLRVEMVVDTEEAKRMWPGAAESINKYGNCTLRNQMDQCRRAQFTTSSMRRRL